MKLVDIKSSQEHLILQLLVVLSAMHVVLTIWSMIELIYEFQYYWCKRDVSIQFTKWENDLSI